MRRSPFTRAVAGWSRPSMVTPVGAVEEVGEHRQLHAGLAEAREHLLDVAEEQPVGADHEHALALEREPVRVEEVGGAVERDDGLAGAGPALHDEHPGQLGADDLVLLALDRGDDVGEAAGASLLERGDERAPAADLAALVDHGELAAEQPGRLAEELVLDGEQLAAAGGEVAAAHEAHRLAAGGPVEGLGDRRPPVDDERLAVLVGHGQPADVVAVAALAAGAVDAAEHQAGVAELERGQPLGDVALDHLPLPAGLLGAALADLDHRAQPGGLLARSLEAAVRVVDVGLLGGQVGVGRHHPPGTRGSSILPEAAAASDRHGRTGRCWRRDGHRGPLRHADRHPAAGADLEPVAPLRPWEARRPAIAATLARLDADVICLQEVWADDDVELRGGAGRRPRLPPGLRVPPRLRRGPVRQRRAVALADRGQRRAGAPVAAPTPRSCARACAPTSTVPRARSRCSAPTSTGGSTRAACARTRCGRSARSSTAPDPTAVAPFPPILCGDFNADPDSDEIRLLTGRSDPPVPEARVPRRWEVAGQASDSSATGATWTNDNPYARLDLEPDRRIDYVFVGWPKAGGAGHVTRCTVEGLEPVDGVVPSDHLAVLAELRY